MTAALWLKAWCETRGRLAVAALVLAASAWFGTGDSVKTLFMLLVIVLGGGSLAQERALGTLGFTLALPVGRSRHLAARVAVGVAETAALAAVVAGRLPFAYSFASGLALLSLALLVSTLVASEVVGWLLSFLALLGYEAFVYWMAFADGDFLRLLGGEARPTALVALVAVSALFLVLADSRSRCATP